LKILKICAENLFLFKYYWPAGSIPEDQLIQW